MSESADAGAVAAVVAEAVATAVGQQRNPQAKRKTVKTAEDVAAEAEAEESTTYVMSNHGMAKSCLSIECGRRESGRGACAPSCPSGSRGARCCSR